MPFMCISSISRIQIFATKRLIFSSCSNKLRLCNIQKLSYTNATSPSIYNTFSCMNCAVSFYFVTFVIIDLHSFPFFNITRPSYLQNRDLIFLPNSFVYVSFCSIPGFSSTIVLSISVLIWVEKWRGDGAVGAEVTDAGGL